MRSFCKRDKRPTSLWLKLNWNWRAIGHMCYSVRSIRVWWIVDEMDIDSTSKFINLSEKWQLRSAAHTNFIQREVNSDAYFHQLVWILNTWCDELDGMEDGSLQTCETHTMTNQLRKWVIQLINGLICLFVAFDWWADHAEQVKPRQTCSGVPVDNSIDGLINKWHNYDSTLTADRCRLVCSIALTKGDQWKL